MLTVRPHTKSGGGQSTSGPIYEKWGGGGVNSLQVRYEKWGGRGGNSLGQFAGAIRFWSDTKRGGGGADTFVWHKENTLSLNINGYNFDQGGSSSTSHARAKELKVRF